MGPYHGVDYNLTLMFTPESTPTHLPWDWAMGNPIPEAYARVDFIPPVRDFGFGLCSSIGTLLRDSAVQKRGGGLVGG